jgi:hypothetical protein
VRDFPCPHEKKPGAAAGLEGWEKWGAVGPPRGFGSLRRDGGRLGVLGIGRCLVVHTVLFAIGQERRQRIRSGFGLAIDPSDLGVRCAQGLDAP